MYVTVYNPGQTSVVISDTGRVLGGGEWGVANSTDDAVKEGLAHEWLLKVQRPEAADDVRHDVLAVFDQTEAWQQRHDAFANMEKADLLDMLVSSEVVEEGSALSKPELVRVATENPSVSPPEPPKASRTSGDSNKSKGDSKPANERK